MKFRTTNGRSMEPAWRSAVLGVLVAVATPVMAAQIPPSPDLSGTWTPVRGSTPEGRVGIGFPEEGEVPFQPSAEERSRTGEPQNDLDSGCIPRGAVRMTMTAMLPFDILQTGNELLILYGQHAYGRRIFTDGRLHPDDAPATYYGHSIGRWEGDTLIVDTVGENPATWLNSGPPGLPHTDALHVVERIRLVEDARYLEFDVTIEDPQAYTEPIRVSRLWRRTPAVEDPEFVCEEALQARSAATTVP